MSIMKRGLALLMVLLVALLAWCAAEEGVFLRIDRDDPEAWKGELANVRFLEEEGMSGSAQFSEGQFMDLAAQLNARSEEAWVVDCRLESHGFINGIAVSWCDSENAANQGKTAAEVEAAEAGLSELVGATVQAYTSENDQPKDGVEMTVETWQTERALVEAEGLRYLRLACPDHCWPTAGVIDDFIAFARDLDAGAWLHFHCQAGSGRTGAFMTIYEMMQKPDAPVEDILRHQAETGSGNLVDRAAPEKSYAQKERCVMARAMYRYIRENRETGYGLKWSDWLAAHSRAVEMRVGDHLDGSGFSSDELVVTDSLQAVAAGRAAVLVDGEVWAVTVTE